MIKIRSFIIGFIFFCLFTTICKSSSMAQTPFQRMDRNDDGRLSQQEFRGPSQAFKRMDGNADGYISRQEADDTPLTSGKNRRSSRDGMKGRSEQPVIEQSAGRPAGLIYVDTHNHLVGRTSGEATRQFDYEGPAQTALVTMDSTGVKVNLVMPMPQGVE